MSLIASGREEASAPPRGTRAESLRLQLADEIVHGQLAPGSALAQAIRMLAASGLVEMRAHRAAVVARPNHETLIGMFEVMAELEALCAGYAAERMTAPERRAMENEHEKLRVLIQSGDPQRYHEVNEAFHGTIYAGSHNSYLAELTLMTRARVRPFRRAQFRIRGRLAKSHLEHDRVVQAILRGERVMAAQAMYAHIVTVGEEYEHYSETL